MVCFHFKTLLTNVCQRRTTKGTSWQQMSRLMTKPTKRCAPSEDSDQPVHPLSLIWVFAVCSMGSWRPSVSSCGQRRLWSDWADVQADLSLHLTQRSLCLFCHEAAQMLMSCANNKDADQPAHPLQQYNTYTVKILNIRTPQKFAVINLKFGFTKE